MDDTEDEVTDTEYITVDEDIIVEAEALDDNTMMVTILKM